jgi:hypothetical protein
MSPSDIKKMFDQMEKDVESIRAEALRNAWIMRGGLSYSDALNLSFTERKLIVELNKENMEATKKSGLPYF